jgi:hypothetical protein
VKIFKVLKIKIIYFLKEMQRKRKEKLKKYIFLKNKKIVMNKSMVK